MSVEPRTPTSEENTTSTDIGVNVVGFEKHGFSRFQLDIVEEKEYK